MNKTLGAVGHAAAQKWKADRKRYVLQRARLHAADPRCHWCRQPTVLPETMPGAWNGARMATIDHLFPKGHPKRLDGNPTGERRRVLACKRCNSARRNPYAVSGQHKSLEEAWRASRQWPRMAYQTGALPWEIYDYYAQ